MHDLDDAAVIDSTLSSWWFANVVALAATGGDRQLPATGTDVGRQVLAAFALLGAGALLVATSVGRRRARPSPAGRRPG